MKTATPPALCKSEQYFIARGISCAVRTKETGVYVTAEESLGRLRAMLEAKKWELKQKAA